MSDNIKDKNNELNDKVDTSNIFEDFDSDFSLKDDILKAEEEAKKDSMYYLSIVSNIIKYVNLFIILLLTLSLTYIFIQKSDSMKEKSFLDPVCPILLGKNHSIDSNPCSSVSVALDKYTQIYKAEQEKSLKAMVPLIEDLFLIEDFKNSKRVSFVLDKSETKHNPMLILNEFDKVKNDFVGDEKNIISCSAINIYDNILEANCSSFSAEWNEEIIGYNGKKGGKDFIEGTSISTAASFINFLDLSSSFRVLDPQKQFTSQRFLEKGYNKKTDFKIKLKYSNSNLSL